MQYFLCRNKHALKRIAQHALYDRITILVDNETRIVPYTIPQNIQLSSSCLIPFDGLMMVHVRPGEGIVSIATWLSVRSYKHQILFAGEEHGM
ncbi:hypothetical protein NXS19_009381 [Fusarium pseudograminearum]|nr:hypothetical protein NXS19_009381 [Fusarium pseudograminearum]